MQLFFSLTLMLRGFNGLPHLPQHDRDARMRGRKIIGVRHISHVLSGEEEDHDIFLNSLPWYEENDITLHAGVRVTRIDRFARVVFADDGSVTPYDELIIATKRGNARKNARERAETILREFNLDELAPRFTY